MNAVLNWSDKVCAGAAATALLIGSGCLSITRVGETGAKPDWYHRADPQPSSDYYYFTGYAEGASGFPQARRLAEDAARRAAGRFLGTDVVERMTREIVSANLDWKDVEKGGLSTHGQDILKEEIKSLVAQSVEMARTSDLYVEKVVVKRGILARPDIRYDAGALLEYPRSELERIKAAKMQRTQAAQASSEAVKRAETLWANGEKNAAIELMQKERRLDPANGEISYRLAQYLEDAGQRDQALEILKALAERNDGNTWTKLAEARVTAFHNSELSDTFRVIRKHGFASGSIKDVLSWGSEGQVGRARQMGREQFEAAPEDATNFDDRLPKLVAWYLCSGADVAQSNALAARYDLQKSGAYLRASLAEVTEPRQAEPTLLVLLAFIRQGLADDMAYDLMADLRRQLPEDAGFSEPLRDLAVLTLNDSPDRRSGDFLRWLNAN